MAIPTIDPNRFYYPQDYAEDLRNQKPLFLGTTYFVPTDKWIEYVQLLAREAVIRTNFVSQQNLSVLGKVEYYKKPPLTHYNWQVIKVIIQAFYSGGIWPVLNAAFFLLVTTSSIVVLCFPLLAGYAMILSFPKIHTEPRTFILAASICLVFSIAAPIISWVNMREAFNGSLLPTIKQAREPFLNEYVLFQNVSQIPNSMQGFDIDQLANDKTEDGWMDPITLKTIPADQISSTRILRIGKYAISIIPALQSMLTREYKNCPFGEIPHPIETRPLEPEEKKRFLSEASAFFGIDSQQLEKFWQIKIKAEKVNFLINNIDYFWYASNLRQAQIRQDIEIQLLHRKRKLKLCRLLTYSVRTSYFDDDFDAFNLITYSHFLLNEEDLTASGPPAANEGIQTG